MVNSAERVTVPGSEASGSGSAGCEPSAFSTQLSSYGFSFAKHWKTGTILLVFGDSAAAVVRHIRTIRTLEIKRDLSEDQKRELEDNMDYFEQFMRQRDQHER
jgi:hypothetical protein